MSDLPTFSALILAIVNMILAQEHLNYNNFVSHFSRCKMHSADFDTCMKDAINDVRPYFKTGVPELNISPFDPFFVKELSQTRGGNNFSYRLILKNVHEKGWTDSMITKFKSNMKKGWVQYSQYFPEKYLDGNYEFEGKLMSSKVENRGHWNLTLYDYIQTTTVTKPFNSKSLKVRIEVQSCGDMDLHIGNLLRGRTFMEGMLDRIINYSWRPGFAVVRPLINDLVSRAFTDIFNDAFSNLDLNKIVSF